MEYHTEYINYNAIIKRIYHISDIHINLQSKHDEYRYVFNNLYTFFIEEKKKYNIKLSENKNIECCIVITGDILHSKTELLPECIELTREFLTRCAELMPTIMIAGNHDMNVNNKERLDGLTPIRNGIRDELPLYYFKKSGLYHFGNIIWSLAAVQDYLIIPASEIKSKENSKEKSNKTTICLFHGRVNGVVLFNKTKINGEVSKITNKTITPESFKGYDYALLGDIHKQQFMNKEKTIAYSGSLIQQNHGESIDKHGVLIWDIENGKTDFKEIHNDYCFYTHEIKDCNITNEDIDKISKSLMKTHIRLRLYLYNTPYSKLQHIIALFKNNFNVLEVNHQDCSAGIDSDIKKEITMNITNVEYQNKLIEEYLLRYTDTNEKNIDYIKRLNELSNKQLEKNDMWLNARWKLVKLEFSNLFSYGENNVINFHNHKGVLGIIAPNHMGKSAIIDIILFTLYDKFPRKGNVKDIVNNRKNSFKSKIIFKIGEWKYVIFKSGNKTDKGRVSSKIDFYRINKENIKEVLNEDTSVKTKNSILKYVGLYDDIIQTNISLQNNNCNFIEAENTARKKELERILQVDFINELQKKANLMISEKRSIYKHLQNNCYEEAILQLNTNISESIIELKSIDVKQNGYKQQITQIESIIQSKMEQLIPNIEEQIEAFKTKLGDLPTKKLEELKQEIKLYETDNKNLITSIENGDKLQYKNLYNITHIELEELKHTMETTNDTLKIQNETDIKDINYKIETSYKLLKHTSDSTENQEGKLNDMHLKIKELESSYNTIQGIETKINNLKTKYNTHLKSIREASDNVNKFKEEELPKIMYDILEETNVLELEHLHTTLEQSLSSTNDMTFLNKLNEFKLVNKELSIYNYLEKYQTELEDKYSYKNKCLKTIEHFKLKNESINNEVCELIKTLPFKNGDNTFNTYNVECIDTILLECNKYKLDIKHQIKNENDLIDKYNADIIILKENNKINKQINTKIKSLNVKRNELMNYKNSKYQSFIKNYNICNKIKYNARQIQTFIKEQTEIETHIEQNIKIEDDYKQNNANKTDIIEFKCKLKELKTDYDKMENNMNIIKMEFTKNNTKLEQHKKEISKMKDIEKELSIYTVYNEALKNLPFIIIKKVIPRLETKINELLSVCTNFVVKVEVDNNHIDIYIDRPVYNGRLILLNNASGFERFISSLAIRLALLDISQLPKPNFIAIDEGWTSFDYQNINNVRTIFDFLVEKFDFVLSISHLSQIKEHCQQQIHLKKDKEDYSVIC